MATNTNESHLGTDLAFTPEGDLILANLDEIGLETLTGVELVKTALMRVLHTVPHVYSKWIRTQTGFIELDEEYQDKAIQLVSAPMNYATDRILQYIREAVSVEKRIELQDLRILPTTEVGVLPIRLVYRILEVDEIDSIDLTIN